MRAFKHTCNGRNGKRAATFKAIENHRSALKAGQYLKNNVSALAHGRKKTRLANASGFNLKKHLPGGLVRRRAHCSAYSLIQKRSSCYALIACRYKRAGRASSINRDASWSDGDNVI